MLSRTKLLERRLIKLLRKRPWYCRLRRLFPGWEDPSLDDRAEINDADLVEIAWPAHVKKPKFGIVRDVEPYPRWSKYCRFLENNSFEYEVYNIHAHDWIQQAEKFDIVVGIWSCEFSALKELREKYYFLETYLGKSTFPSPAHAFLYEDKKLEAYIAAARGFPFAKTYVSCERDDALRLIERLRYPLVSKIVPSSGSVGIELVRHPRHARKIVKRAFSASGRKTHLAYARQKNYVYFQEFIPNDGYDIRAILIGNWVWGYYRKVLKGDFRASGMNQVEKRALPKEAMALALALNEFIKSPMLVVDMLHGLDGEYRIIEYSPVCQIETVAQLEANGIPGAFVFDEEGNCEFRKCQYWLHELALRDFLMKDYLPKLRIEPKSCIPELAGE